MEVLESMMNIRSMCRLCAREVEGLMDLFSSNTPGHIEATLIIETVYNCTSVKIAGSDIKPTKVCAECWHFVEKMHNFKKKCLLSDAYFQHHMTLLRASNQEVHQDTPLEDDSICFSNANEKQNCGSSNPGEVPISPSICEEPEYDFEIVKVEIEEEDDSTNESNSCKFSACYDKISIAPKCGKSARVYTTSPREIQSAPKNSKSTCQICWREFSRQSSLNRHMECHIMKTMRCKFCKKEFKNKESLHRHERMHTEDNPHKCHVCGKSYSSSSALVAHVRKHTGETPFRCSDCNETFYLVSSYERHVARHRGVKEFECEICNNRFWVVDDLRAHVNRAH